MRGTLDTDVSSKSKYRLVIFPYKGVFSFINFFFDLKIYYKSFPFVINSLNYRIYYFDYIYRSADDLDDDFQLSYEPEFMIAYDKEGKLLEPLNNQKNDGKTLIVCMFLIII